MYGPVRVADRPKVQLRGFPIRSRRGFVPSKTRTNPRDAGFSAGLQTRDFNESYSSRERRVRPGSIVCLARRLQRRRRADGRGRHEWSRRIGRGARRFGGSGGRADRPDAAELPGPVPAARAAWPPPVVPVYRGSGGTATTQTLCAKYGGAANVGTVIKDKVIPEIAGDCRINKFFTSLTAAGLNHVVECLSIQAQELFSCPGVSYAGSKDSAGVACRSMVDAHASLGISKGDFDALIEDVVAGLAEGGVAQADIQAAAPALLGMQGAIVKNQATTATQNQCDGGTAQTLCSKYGGAAGVASAIKDKVIPEIAGDCRINSFFTSLTAAGLNHVVECLSIQAQELFSCPGVTYAGSKDSAGVTCRSMALAHANLGISKGDFNALIDDVVAGLTEAGVAQADIQAAAPALLGMEGAIVKNQSTMPTSNKCDGGP